MLDPRYRRSAVPMGLATLLLIIGIFWQVTQGLEAADATERLPESIEVVYRLDLEHCSIERSDRATLCRAAAVWRREDAYRSAAARLACSAPAQQAKYGAVCRQLVAGRQ
jgi:hypothetical protein